MSQLTRRQIIKALGASAVVTAAVPIPSFAFQAKKLGVALVGLGNYSENILAPALQATKHCELKGIVTGSPSKIPQWQEKYAIKDSNVYSYDNMHEVANNPEIDVLYIVTPTGTHMKYAVIAANAGKHVWCEKPMAMSVKECEAIIAACQKNKVRLSVSYRMQHEPNTIRFGDYAMSKPFGELTKLTTRAGYAGGERFFTPDNWRLKKALGGGALYDMGVYPLNAARYFTKMEPVSVSAKHVKSFPKVFTEVDETTYFTLEFANGLVADCGTSMVTSFNHANMQCQEGWYELRPMSRYSGVKGFTSKGEEFAPISGMQQTLQMDNDALAILQNSPVLVPGSDGLADISVIEALFKSAANDGKVVKI